jgi:DNA polymerase III delta subunit
MGLSWLNPPPVVVIGGNEVFLRHRQIRQAVLATEKSGRRVVRADSDAEAVDALTVASTFGDSSLVIVGVGEVAPETVASIQKSQPYKTCLVLQVDGKLDAKKYPVLDTINAALQVQFNIPKSRKDQKALAVKFVMKEAVDLLGNKKAMDRKLAEAVVKRTVGMSYSLGTLHFEVSKMAALARSKGESEITVDTVKAVLRPSTEYDLEPLREAMRVKDATRIASALHRLRAVGGVDPTMLLLRGRGSPADLALKWLQTAVLLGRGASASEIAARTGTPAWAVERDLIPAARRWGVSALRELVRDFSRADRGVLLGAPAPWISCEIALLLRCSR